MSGDQPAPGVTVRPVVLLDDRFSCTGDMVTVSFNPISATITLHLATEGAGTATGLLDETTAVLLATALLKGSLKVEPDDYRVRAAYALLADCHSDAREGF